MLVAVTGASGHVGGNLCRLLLKNNHTVRALVHKNDKALQGLTMEFVQGNILDKDSIKNLIDGSEAVIHLAAHISISGKEKNKVFQANIDGTDNVVNTALTCNVKRFIHFSSIHAFQQYPFDCPLDEKRNYVGHDSFNYDYSKAESEKIVKNAFQHKGLNAVILNPTSIIGPFDFKPSLMGSALIRLFNNSLPAIVPGGYDWVDVRDVSQAAFNSLEKGTPGENYILSGHWLSLKQISILVNDLTGSKTNKISCPAFLAKLALPFFNIHSYLTKTPPLYTNVSLEILLKNNHEIINQKACTQLGFVSRPIEDTILDSFNWFKSNGYL